jgi:hemerythrin-like metal-binding protein
MAFLTWSEEYSVKVKMFDDEHIHLMELINQLHDGLHSGKAKDVLTKVIDEMIAYTTNHFKHEESELRKYKYPHLREHIDQHELLRESVIEFRSRLTHGFSSALAIEMSKFLKVWLLKHIQVEDMQYGAYLNSIGIS